MAYVSGTSLVISSLATGATVTVPGVAATPRWSPTGDEIAFLGVTESYWPVGELRAVRPDGTGLRGLTATGSIYRAQFDYSPDGKYLIAAARTGVLTVIDVATGQEIPVSLPKLDHGLLSPSWKP
jgi:Tol biopolymer transport system component